MTTVSLSTLCLFVCLSAGAQPGFPDSAVRVSEEPVVQRYLAETGRYSRLYNGPEYTSVYPKTIGTAFLGDGSFQTGSVNYAGAIYAPVIIALDLVGGNVLIRDSASNIIMLLPEKLLSFTIANRRFVNLQPRQADGIGLSPRIYEVWDYAGVSVWAARQKKVQRGFKAEDPDRFIEYNEYFLRLPAGDFAVTGESSLLRAFGPQGSQVRSLMGKSGLRYRRDPELFMQKAAELYAGLKK